MTKELMAYKAFGLEKGRSIFSVFSGSVVHKHNCSKHFQAVDLSCLFCLWHSFSALHKHNQYANGLKKSQIIETSQRSMLLHGL